MDPFAVLGVQPGASDKAIREAYLRLSRVRHPDMGGTDEAMQELNAAYEQALRGGPRPVPPPPPRPHPPGPPPPPPPRPAPPSPPRPRGPRQPFYKKKRYWIFAAALIAFLASSGATESPSPKTRPAVYGLIGRCVDLGDQEIGAVVPCAGPHDAWVVDVVPRPEGVCPPLATGYVGTISHFICITTER